MLKIALLMLVLLGAKAQATVISSDNQKIVQIAVKEIPYSFSPYATTPLNAQYSHLFFDPLVRWGKDKKIEFRLLNDVKRINKNKIRFSLKQNIAFHSGNMLTSQDVIWTLKEAKHNKYLRHKLQNKIKITPVTQYQFDIQTELTQVQLFDYLTHLFILDSAYYEKNKIKHNAAQLAVVPPIHALPLSGTGPYRINSFYAGVNLRVQANMSYWESGPMFKTLNFVKIKSIDSRLYALLADDVDISEAISDKNINSVYALDNKSTYQTAPFNALFLTINEEKNDLFERETSRNAIHLALNQVGILKHILYDTGTLMDAFKADKTEMEAPIYNADRAKYLLKKIEAPNELSLLVMVQQEPYMTEVVFALINMLKKVGITLEVVEVETAKRWREEISKHDLLLSTWHSPLVVSANVYQDIFANSLLSSYIEKQFNTQKKILSMDEKIVLFEQYQLTNRIIPLFSKNKIWAADNQFLLGDIFSSNAIPYWHLLKAIH